MTPAHLLAGLRATTERDQRARFAAALVESAEREHHP